MLNIGDTIPNFKGTNQDGVTIQSADFKGSKLVVFFFPKANTPGCTAEVCNFSDNIHLLKKEGYRVIGISADSVDKQKKFHDKYILPYDLIADESKDICKAFGVWQPKKFMGKEFMGIVRTTFIFSEEGLCTRIIDKVKTKEATSQILNDN